MKTFVNYHKHDCYSNLISPDSAVLPKEYIKRAKELNHKMVFCTNHGNPYHYYEMYQLCKKEDLKFGFGVEAYWVNDRFEKDNTNNHIIILAKSEKGRKAINLILSEANKTGFYYKPRIDVELIMSLPEKEVMITSACLGFYGYENWEEYICKFHSKFKDNFYLEFQSHLTESQIELNKKLLNISKKNNIKMIAGLDSHYIYEEQKVDRDLFLYSKGIIYEEEKGWFMDYPDYETLYNRFENQNIFNSEEIIQMIDNTNICLTFDNIELDFENIKIPTMYPNKTQEDKDNILKEIIKKELKIKFNRSSIPKEYSEEIEKEWKVIKETKMSDYFILNYHIIKRGIELGGNITLTGRGSSPSWYLCNVLGFTTIDMLKSPLQLFPERFATTDRIKAGSLFDIDFNVSNRPAFIQAQKEILGENNSYFFSAYGKLKEKSCWKMFAKANDIPFEISNEITKYIDKYEKAKKYAETEEDKDDIMVEDFIPKEYIDIYNGSKKYNGVIDSISPAPCGFLLSQYDIREDIGIVRVKDELCANIDGVTADKALMMKNDLLIVTVVDIIYETYKKIGRIPHTSNELIELTKDDKKVWEIFSSGNTVEINQCTNDKSKKRLSVYKPNNLAEISAFVSSIRPAFKSMVDKFINREYFEYGIVEFDKIIQTNEIKSSFILFQETLMRVLNYVGFDIAETYQLLKAIAKKKEGIIEPIKERFINGFIEKEQNGIENANKVWKIMEDSVSYGFNCSHSVAMGLDAIYGAYLKAYYPLEFYSTCIDIYTKKGNNERVAIIKGEMKNFGITEKGVNFKDDNRSIFYNKIEKTISPMLSSIKHINQNCANELYDIGLLQINHFADILDNLKCTNSKQLNILVSLDYFSEFAKPKKLIKFIDKYEKYRNCKTINKEKCEDLDLVKKYCTKETEKQLREIDNVGILKEIWDNLIDEDLSIIDKIKNEVEYLGYATTKDDCDENICIITGINTERSNPMLSLYFLSKGETEVIKIKNKLFNESEIVVFNMIKIMEVSDEFKWMPDGVDKNGKTKFKKGTEKERILTKFKILS